MDKYYLELGKRIPLQGTINTRSLQGYIAKDKRKIKANRVFRSDALINLTKEDIHFFERVNLRYDVDLRGKNEILKNPDKTILGCQYIHSPIQDDLNKSLNEIYPHKEYNIKREDIKGTIEYAFRLNKNGDVSIAFENVYRSFINEEFAQQHYALLLKILLENKEGSVLFHCADGKDRCGTGVMLFLKMLDIDDETIIYDYLKTNENTKAKADSRVKYLMEECQVDNKIILNSVRILAGVRENFILAAMDEINTKYNGFKNYFNKQLGFSDEMIEEMKNNYLE